MQYFLRESKTDLREFSKQTPHTVSDVKSLKTEYQAYLPMPYSNRGYKVFQVKYSAYTECETIPLRKL